MMWLKIVVIVISTWLTLANSASSGRATRTRPKSRFDGVRNTKKGVTNKLLPRDMDALFIVGITGHLGQQIAKHALRSGKYKVFGTTRAMDKASQHFEINELVEMRIFEFDIDMENLPSTENSLVDIISSIKPDIVVEVRRRACTFHCRVLLIVAALNDRCSATQYDRVASKLF